MPLSNAVGRIWSFYVLVTVGVSMCIGQAAPVNTQGRIRGTWILKSIYPTQNVQGPGPSQQRKLLRSLIVISASSVTACGQSAAITSTDVKEVSASEFLADNLVPLDSVGIRKSNVLEIILNNRLSGTCFEVFPMPGQDIYVKSKGELVIAFEGVFYRAVRLK